MSFTRIVFIGALLCTVLLFNNRLEAQELDLSGYAQGDLLLTPHERSWMDGGLGKLRWGGSGTASKTKGELSALLLEATATLPENLTALADIRYDRQQKSALDILDASLRWQPPPEGNWSWSLKLGAFFPPFGLENQDIGWSSPYTLSYSALSSWVGEELRTLGGEFRLKWHGQSDTLSLVGSVFGWNDPAGVELAYRGWDLGDRPLGLKDHLRIPDATARAIGEQTPFYTPEFSEIDNSPGYYTGVIWDHQGLGHLQLYRYDNEVDTSTERNDVYSWRTEFWDLGYSVATGPFSIIAEAMTGSTIIDPDGLGPFTTDFYTAYILGAWTKDAWRAALRLESFGTSGGFSEHGRAVTASINWMPRNWLRLTAEIVTVDSTRAERQLAGLPPHAVETEPRLGMRISF